MKIFRKLKGLPEQEEEKKAPTIDIIVGDEKDEA